MSTLLRPMRLILVSTLALGACAQPGSTGSQDAGPGGLDASMSPGSHDGGDGWDAAGPADGGTPDAALAVDAGAFGQPCSVHVASSCPTGMLCLEGPSGGATGFCTRTCPRTFSGECTGAPEGSAAYCLVTDVDLLRNKACAFVCVMAGATFTCPGALTCSNREDPPGSGQQLCLP